jgi:hypothetical protein
VEQTSFLLMTERAIGEIARELGQTELAGRYKKRVTRRIQAMQQKMWNSRDEFFYSLDRDSDRQIPVRTVQGFLTLSAGAATPAQAASLAAQLKNPRRWWAPYPVPTCALDEPRYNPRGYWRGDMWPPTTYLVAHGLRQYGYDELALELTLRLRALIEERGINENYDSQTGDPLGVSGLGMSCTIWNMMVENLYGVQDDFRTIRRPAEATGRRLKLGKLRLDYPTSHSVEVQSEFDRDFHISFPSFKGSGVPRVTCQGMPVKVAGSLREVRFKALAGKPYRVEF